jgi:predicted TIM-barrel fold metal-dependent hydrolase
MIPGARYQPSYEAEIDRYLRLLDAHDIERAVLVQPSFLGTDNGYLLRCLETHPDRLRGIVVLDPETTLTELDVMAAAGVIGIRFNTLSLPPQRLSSRPYQVLFAKAAKAGLWVEIQAKGSDWPDLLSYLEFDDLKLMIDHFGLPSGAEFEGTAELTSLDPTQCVVKFSAPYRVPAEPVAVVSKRLIDHFGANRCIWGSDWPWTQHETRHGYADCMAWLSEWASPEQRQVMAGSASDILGF